MPAADVSAEEPSELSASQLGLGLIQRRTGLSPSVDVCKSQLWLRCFWDRLYVLSQQPAPRTHGTTRFEGDVFPVGFGVWMVSSFPLRACLYQQQGTKLSPESYVPRIPVTGLRAKGLGT